MHLGVMEHAGLIGMPNEILNMIFKPLDLADKKSLRPVCQRFQEIVDDLVRFNVALTNDTVGTIGQISRAKGIDTLIVGVYNRSMSSTSSTRFPLAGVEVDELVLAGRSEYVEERVSNTASRPFFYPYLPDEAHVVRNFEHWVMRTALLRGTGQLNLRYTLRFTSDTVTSLVISSDVFPGLKDVSMFADPTLWPKLKALELTLVHVTERMDKHKVNKAMGILFDRRFPDLKRIAFITTCKCSPVFMEQWIRFYKCVIAHGGTLEELIIINHFHFDGVDNYLGDAHANFSAEIKEILDGFNQISLKRLTLVIADNTKVYQMDKKIFANSFEMKLLRSQTKLQVLKLDGGRLYSGNLFGMLPEFENLEACSIHLYWSREETSFVTLDFLKKCKQLKILQIVCYQDKVGSSPWRLSGIQKLPLTIEKLCLSTELSIDDACWIHNHLINLTELRYEGGVKPGAHHTSLSLASINNFAHFKECVNKLPKLSTFQIAIPNPRIQAALGTLRRNVRFEVKSLFPRYDVPFYMQH